MTTPTNAYAVIAAMFGIDPAVLRAVAAPWQADLSVPPITLVDFSVRVADAQKIAGGLNNTNLWELAIREAFDPRDIPPSLPTPGIPRRADEDPTKDKP